MLTKLFFSIHFATGVDILRQLFTPLSTAQITEIKGKPFPIKLVTSNVFYRTKIMQVMMNHSSLGRMVSLVIEPTIKYIITTERFIAPLLWAHLLRSPLFLKSLIDSGSPYFIFFSYLDVEFFLYIYFCMPWMFIIKVTLYVICCS